jgi:hypothetical protein
MMTSNLRAAWILLAAVVGCSSHGSQTSSSSHWVSCASNPDCANVAGSVACEQGYCVDANHQRIDGASAAAMPGSTACDPLAAHEQPVTLGTLLGAGRDTAGTIYAADHVEDKSLDRVFVSMGDTLWRKRVLGSGAMGSGADADYNFDFDDGNGERFLLIQRRGGMVTAMSFGAGGKDFIGDSGSPSLTVVDMSVVAAMKLRDLPGEVLVEYVSEMENGSSIVVTRPRDDFTFAAFRLFYGPSSAMVEYPVTDVGRGLSIGGSTTVRFSVGTVQYTAQFTFVTETPEDGGFSITPGPTTLDTGDGKTLTGIPRNPTPTTLPGFAFTCLH